MAEAEGCTLSAAIEREGSPAFGQDAGALAGLAPLGVPVTDDPLPAFAEATASSTSRHRPRPVFYAELAAQARIVHVVGTTGLSPDDFAKLKAASYHARIVQSGNMSLGVNLLAGLVRKVAATLGDEYDIEILEMHHRHKVDAPSGTALSSRGGGGRPGRGLSQSARSRCATAIPARASPGRSALRRCAAAAWSASTA